MSIVPQSRFLRTKDPWERPLRHIANDKLKNQQPDEKEARLLIACYQGREDEVKKILNSGKPQPRVDVSANAQVMVDHDYEVHGKAFRKKTKVSDLKFAKADLYRYGSPMHKAALRGDAGIVEILLESIEGPMQLLKEKTEVGNIPLHCAAYRGNVEVCEILLDALSDVQVDVNTKTGQILTSKCDLTVNGSIAAISCRNQFLSTPVDKAREANQKKVVQLFQEWPARLKKRNELSKELLERLDEYKKDISKLTKVQANSMKLRELVREAENIGRPSIKAQLISDAKALLLRAG